MSRRWQAEYKLAAAAALAAIGRLPGQPPDNIRLQVTAAGEIVRRRG